jgi:hypothetical protein
MLSTQFPAAAERLFYLDLCFHHKDPQSSTKHKDYTLPTIPHRRSLEALDLEGYGAIKIDSPFVAGSDDQPSALPLPAAARYCNSSSYSVSPASNTFLGSQNPRVPRSYHHSGSFREDHQNRIIVMSSSASQNPKPPDTAHMQRRTFMVVM